MARKRRLQILIDEPRYHRLVARARERDTSVAAVIRDAIDIVIPDDRAKKRRAAKAILQAEPMPVPATVEELKAALRGGG